VYRSFVKGRMLGFRSGIKLPPKARGMRLEMLAQKIDEAGGAREFIGHREYDQLVEDYRESRRRVTFTSAEKRRLFDRRFGPNEPRNLRGMTLEQVEEMTALKRRPCQVRQKVFSPAEESLQALQRALLSQKEVKRVLSMPLVSPEGGGSSAGKRRGKEKQKTGIDQQGKGKEKAVRGHAI
jgi:hypothetical protein